MTRTTAACRAMLLTLALSTPVSTAWAQEIVGSGEPTTFAAHADAMARVAICSVAMSDIGLEAAAAGQGELAAKEGLDGAAATAVMDGARAKLEADGIDCDRNDPAMVTAYEAVVFYEDVARNADAESLVKSSLNAILTLVATVEYCQIAIPGEIATGMGRHAIELETLLGLDEEEAGILYGERLEAIRAQKLDCSEGSPVLENLARGLVFFGGEPGPEFIGVE